MAVSRAIIPSFVPVQPGIENQDEDNLLLPLIALIFHRDYAKYIHGEGKNMFKQHLIIFVAVVTMTDVMVIQQSYAQANTPKSNIVNSVYLTIKDQKFGIKDSVITGTIVNNSTYQIKLAQVYALLYNGNHLITVVSGLVDVTTLNPGDDSAFVVSLLGLSFERYTLMPGGIPA